MWNFLQDLRSWPCWRALFPHSVRCELIPRGPAPSVIALSSLQCQQTAETET
jgi:hypothetical protein